MYTWNSVNGNLIHWYKCNSYRENIFRSQKNMWIYRCFNEWTAPVQCGLYRKGFIVPETFETDKYLNNFITELPEKAILFFDKSSKFPRNKIIVSEYKRVIKPEKASVVVIGQQAEVINIDDTYCIFTDGTEIFGIMYDDLQRDFDGDLRKLHNNTVLGLTIKQTSVLYFGKLKCIYDDTETIKKFNDQIYTQPFILDNDLDKIINTNLSDPILQELVTISEMLQSSDNSIVKMGILMVSGYNLNKWLLTFRVLMGYNTNWTDPYNGGNSVNGKQIWNTLGLHSRYGGLHNISSLILAANDSYLDEDVALAKEFTKTLPTIKSFCEKNQRFYLDTLPFIPDEYKQ